MESMKSGDEKDDLSEIVHRREESFRNYFPTTVVPRETIGNTCQTWDHILDPPQKSRKFKKLEYLVGGLYRNSSQLVYEELVEEYFSEYPVPLAPTTTMDKTMDASKVREFTGEDCYETVYNSYVPEVDLNRLVSELECFRQRDASGSDEKPQHDAAEDNRAKPPTASNDTTVVPSLASLAQAAVTKKTLQDSLLLEEQFSARLEQLRSSARQSIKETVSCGQRTLEESAEAQQVRKLREQLAQAEQALHDLEDKLCSEYQLEVDKIQGTYDQDWAKEAAKYMKERTALIQQQTAAISHEGMAFCSGCAIPFSPRQRGNPRDCCSVEGCQSGLFYCLDCASSRCSKCCNPICLLHTTFHQFECNQNVKKKCGYSEDQDSLEKGLAKGCCGRRMGLVHSVNHCKICGVVVCSDCEDWDMRHLAPKRKLPYCPGCSPARSRDATTGEPARKRMRETSKYDAFMTPVERAVMSTQKWEREQEDIHEKFVTNRLEALTKDEYDQARRNIGGFFSEYWSERDAKKFYKKVSDIESLIWWFDRHEDDSWLKWIALEGIVDRKICPCGHCKLEARKQKAYR